MYMVMLIQLALLHTMTGYLSVVLLPLRMHCAKPVFAWLLLSLKERET